MQTDRPVSEYWNSGMVQGLRDLAIEFGVTIAHFTEQSHHNKVCLAKQKLTEIVYFIRRTKLTDSFQDIKMRWLCISTDTTLRTLDTLRLQIVHPSKNLGKSI